MRTILIVSPNFPPNNTPDMHRIRISLPHLIELGWNPIVLSVDSRYVESIMDPDLVRTIPSSVKVKRVRAIPAKWTRKIGIGNLGLRSFPYLYLKGSEIIKNHEVDLVYFSTTMFTAMPLGRLWKTRFRVPFVLDMQDPWYGEYYKNRPKSQHPPKYWLANVMNRYLEQWTMKEVDGIIAVSSDYIDTLEERYPWVKQKPAKTITFGVSENDFEIMKSINLSNNFFRAKKDRLNGVYVGRLGNAMVLSLTILLRALRQGLIEKPNLFSNLCLHFIGTDYSPAHLARKTAEPLAKELGLEKFIHEDTNRIPYFQSLKMLVDSDFLIIVGSDNPQYTASKIFPYIMARKPMLGLFHENSSVVEIVNETKAGDMITIDPCEPLDDYVKQLLPIWTNMLMKIPYRPETDWGKFKPYTASEITRQQCELFERVLSKN
jgi:hypothetical protein